MALINGEKVLNILGSNNRVIYIPIYQRNYDWKAEDAVKLVNDIWEYRHIVEKDDESLYFAGSMIYKKMIDDNSAQDKISLVDGQQRITTFLLMIKAISEHPQILAEPYLFSNSKDNKTLKISRAKSEATLEKILSGAHDELSEEEKKGNYWLNYLAIKKEIEREEMDRLKIFNLLRDSVAVAWVQLKKSEDENIVFETINSTGKPLTASDLIKNFTLSKIHKFNEEDALELEKIYNSRIEDIFSRSDFKNDEFFRFFIAIKGTEGLIKKDNAKKIYFAFRNMVEKKYDIEKFEDVKELLLVIQKSALIYQRAIDKNIPDIQNYRDSKQNLFKLILRDNMAYFPIYYELVNYWTKLEDNQLTFNSIDVTEYDILESISKYYFFRRISGRKDKNITRDIVSYFEKYIAEAKNIDIKGFEKFLAVRESHDQQLPSFEEVIRNIKVVTYGKDRTLLKHILIAVEIETDKESTAPFNLLKHKLELEHILPQESNLWREEFRKNNRINEFHEFDDRKDLIQNMTLLTEKRNREIKNAIFKEKKDSIIKDSSIQINAIFKKYNKYNNEFLNARLIQIITNFANFYGSKITNTNEYLKSGAEIKQTIENNDLENSNFIMEDKEVEVRIRNIENDVLNGKYENVHSELRTCLERILENEPSGALFDKITNLKNNDINSEIIDAMHYIRLKGNKEVHSLDKTTSKATSVFALESFHKIVTWKEQKISDFNADKYSTPSVKYIYKIDSLKETNSNPKKRVTTKNTKEIDPEKERIEKEKLKMLDVKDHFVDKNLSIFNYVPYKETPTKAYSKNSIEGFDKELSKEALHMYLFKSIGNDNIDKKLLPNMKRDKGWVTAATIAYYQIDTGGKARGSLSGWVSEEKAKELIEELVNYEA